MKKNSVRTRTVPWATRIKLEISSFSWSDFGGWFGKVFEVISNYTYSYTYTYIHTYIHTCSVCRFLYDAIKKITISIVIKNELFDLK